MLAEQKEILIDYLDNQLQDSERANTSSCLQKMQRQPQNWSSLNFPFRWCVKQHCWNR